MLKYAYIELPKEIGLELLIGILLAAVVATFVPIGRIIKVYLGGAFGYVFAVVFGLIMYICSTATVPLALQRRRRPSVPHPEPLQHILSCLQPAFADTVLVPSRGGEQHNLDGGRTVGRYSGAPQRTALRARHEVGATGKQRMRCARAQHEKDRRWASW